MAINTVDIPPILYHQQNAGHVLLVKESYLYVNMTGACSFDDAWHVRETRSCAIPFCLSWCTYLYCALLKREITITGQLGRDHHSASK